MADTDLVTLLARACERLLDALYEAMDDAGAGELTGTQLQALRLIDAGVARPTDLAGGLRITSQAVSGMLDQLQARGLIARAGDPEDGRVRLARLTEQGKQVATAMEQALARIERDWAQRVGQEQIEVLRRCLDELVGHGRARASAPARRLRYG